MTMTDATPTTVASDLSTALTIGYTDAMSGIAAVLPCAAPAKDMSAVLVAVLVTPEHFIATDRYTIARYTHRTPIHPDTDSAIIPRQAAEWLTKQTAKMLNRDVTYLASAGRVEFTAEGVTITADGDVLAVTTFGAVGGKFPPVARLIDGWQAATEAQPVSLDTKLLARFDKSVTALSTRHYGPEFILELGASSTGKPGPLRVTIGDRFDGLIQPKLIRR